MIKDVWDISRFILQAEQCFTLKDLAVNGKDVMTLGVETGPIVGKVLNHLLNMVLDDKIANDRDILIDEAKRYLKEENQ